MKIHKLHARLVSLSLAASLWVAGSVLVTRGTPLVDPTRTPDCPGVATMDCSGVPELICKTACNQHQSLVIRDRCKYRQRLHMERYEKPKAPGLPPGERKQFRDTEVEIGYQVDENDKTNYLVVPRVVADTDDKGVPKTKVNPKESTGLTSQAFLDLIFFPLLPEKLPYYEFEPAPAEREGERAFRFKPKANIKSVPLAVGIVYVNGTTGDMLTVQVEAMYNLAVLDKHLKDIESISATVDYSEFNGRFRMPTLARGEGISNVTKFKGYFKFNFEESAYVPALTLPSWSGISTNN